MQQVDVTELLTRWRGGDQAAVEQLTPIVYRELRRIAAAFLRRERSGHTLQGTALVHEAYIRLLESDSVPWQTKSHFFAFASQLFRRILVDHARKRNRHKRAGDAAKVVLDDHLDLAAPRSHELIRLDDALQSLAKLDPRQVTVVEMKFFGGLEIEEIAEALQISPATVKRDWATARAWLLREITR